MNFDQAMTSAEKTGKERREKLKKFYPKAVWFPGCVALLGAAIWLPSGPLGTYVADQGHTTGVSTSHATMAAPTRCPPATSQERRGCDITSAEWSPAVRWESGRDNGMKMCHSRGILSRRTDEGTTIFYFRAQSLEGAGQVRDRVEYQLYPLDAECRLVGF